MKQLLIDTVDESKETSMASSSLHTEETTQDIIPLSEMDIPFVSPSPFERERDGLVSVLR